jgi:hypothetical protein
MDIAATEHAIVARAGAETLAKLQPAPTIATITESALMASATAVLDLLERIARFVRAQLTATEMASA